METELTILVERQNEGYTANLVSETPDVTYLCQKICDTKEEAIENLKYHFNKSKFATQYNYNFDDLKTVCAGVILTDKEVKKLTKKPIQQETFDLTNLIGYEIVKLTKGDYEFYGVIERCVLMWNVLWENEYGELCQVSCQSRSRAIRHIRQQAERFFEAITA